MTDKEKSIYRDIIHLLTDNTTVHENIELCLESPKNYFISNFDRFDERGMDEDESVPQWCNILDKKWLSEDGYVAGIDIDSDSYVIFPSQRKTLKKLVLLGKQLNHRFDLAKNL